MKRLGIGTGLGISSLVALGVASALTGCSENATPAEEIVADSESSIIAGQPVDGGAFEAVGAVVALFPDGSTFPFCSGTLIEEDAILTAKHCLITVPSFLPIGFAFGPDAFAPERVIAIDRTAWDRDQHGGVMNLGADVGVARLVEEVHDIAPIPIGTLASCDVGRSFYAVGYGLQGLTEPLNPNGPTPAFGTRHGGPITLRAIDGRFWENVFGSFEAFADAATALDFGPGGTASPEALAFYQQIWDTTLLLPGYEAFVGGAPGDVATSRGDSGGPLIGWKHGKPRVYGVTSGTLQFDAAVDPALSGGIYATFGKEARQLIEGADRCEVATEWGVCDGNELSRCDDSGPNHPREKEKHCKGATSACVEAPAGATCMAKCAADSDCDAVAPGGTCDPVSGSCAWARDCHVEGTAFACYLCCTADNPDAAACAESCFSDPALVQAHPASLPMRPIPR